MTYKFTNNATGRLTSSITDVETTLVVGGTEGDQFPELQPGDTFQATIVDEDGNREIVLVTERTTNTLTVLRAQEGTIPREFATGSLVSHRLTAAALTDFAQRSSENDYPAPQNFATASIHEQLKLRGAAAETAWTLDVSDGPPDPNPEALLGHNLRVRRYSGASEFIDEPLTIDRSTGRVEMPYVPQAAGRAIDAFPAGTRMLFQQTNAPVGWTKITEHNDKALRVVSGTAGAGGTMAFTTAFAERTIAQENLPDVNLTGTTSEDGEHTHGYTWRTQNWAAGSTGSGNFGRNSGTGNTDPSGKHTHDVTVSLGGSGTPFDFSVQYVDIIIGEKD